MSTTTQIESLIQMYSTWNYGPIAMHLSKDVVYSSTWVLLPIESKKSFLNFIKSKLQKLKIAFESGRLSLNVIKLQIESIDLLKIS